MPRIFIHQSFFYSPTDTQVNCLKNNFKIDIQTNIKTSPICFGVDTPSSGSALFVLASTNKALPDDGVTVTPKHVGAVLMLILM